MPEHWVHKCVCCSVLPPAVSNASTTPHPDRGRCAFVHKEDRLFCTAVSLSLCRLSFEHWKQKQCFFASNALRTFFSSKRIQHTQGANYGGTRGSSALLNKTWAPLKTWFVKFGGGGGGLKKYWQCVILTCNFSLWSSWIIMCKTAKNIINSCMTAILTYSLQ